MADMRIRRLTPLLEALELKALARAGWVRTSVSNPESVAAHTWGVSFLVLTLLPEDLDRERALTYAVLHDLPEIRIGDITPADHVPPEEKSRREHEAIEALCRTLPRGSALRAAWQAYEAQADPEARFVRELDRLDMALQALLYARAGNQSMALFVASAAQVIEHPVLKPLLDEIQQAIQSACQ